MNQYVNSLAEQNKLDLVLKPNQWSFGKTPFMISGPCSVESEEMIVDWAKKLKALGVDALRGGAYKPCTFPVRNALGAWKEGLREQGLEFLKTAREESGLPIVSEIMDPRQINSL